MKYLYVLALIALMTGCDKTPSLEHDKSAIAVIDGLRIDEKMMAKFVDYKMALVDASRKINYPMRKPEKAEARAKRREKFEKTIKREYLFKQVVAAASRRAGVKASDESLNRIRGQYEMMLGRKPGCYEAVLPVLEKFGMREDFERNVEDEAVALTYMRSLNPQVNLDVTEADVDEVIQRIAKRNAKVEARNSVVYQTATNVLERLKAGQDFGLLAHEFSYAEDKEDGGDMGQIILSGDDSYCKYAPAYTRALMMQDGAISDVVETPMGLEIFQVVSHTELEDPDDPIMKKMRHICFRLEAPEENYKRKDIRNALTQSRVEELYGAETIRKIVEQVPMTIKGFSDPKAFFVPGTSTTHKEHE